MCRFYAQHAARRLQKKTIARRTAPGGIVEAPHLKNERNSRTRVYEAAHIEKGQIVGKQSGKYERHRDI